MTRASKYWTPFRTEKFKSLWNSGMMLAAIAVELAGEDNWIVTTSCLSQKAKELGLSPRQKKVIPNPERSVTLNYEFVYLKAEADRRGISYARLVSTLLKTIAKDKLVNAILDDDVAVVEAPLMQHA